MNKRGFTLIEIMIVGAIIGILAAVIIPKFMGYKVDVVEKYRIMDTMYIGVNKIQKVCWDGSIFLVDPEGEVTDIDETCNVELAKPATPNAIESKILKDAVDKNGRISYK